MPARGWLLRGYRPEASAIIRELRGRRSEPVKEGNSIDAEIRICALYVTQPEMSLRALAAQSHMRASRVKEILKGWGVDCDTRELHPWPPAQEEGRLCVEEINGEPDFSL